MKSKLLTSAGQNTYVLVFEKGDDVLSSLNEFIKEHDLTASQFTGIGAFSEVELGFFDFSKKEYQKILIDEQVELLSINGDVALNAEGGHQLHAHVVVGKSTGEAFGGHLLKATVRPTLELILTESPTYMRRKHDPETGLSLIDLEAE